MLWTEGVNPEVATTSDKCISPLAMVWESNSAVTVVADQSSVLEDPKMLENLAVSALQICKVKKLKH